MQRAKSVALLHSKVWRLETRGKRWRGSDVLQLAEPVLSESRGAFPERGTKRGCHSMSLDVIECHTCDIARFIHKLRLWNWLALELRSNVSRFLEKRILL